MPQYINALRASTNVSRRGELTKVRSHSETGATPHSEGERPNQNQEERHETPPSNTQKKAPAPVPANGTYAHGVTTHTEQRKAAAPQ